MKKQNYLSNHFVDIIALILLLICISLHNYFPVLQIIYAPYTYFGILFILFGFTMTIFTNYLLIENKTTINTFEIPTSLVTTKIFNISRNPIYLGMVLIFFGIVIFLGSIISFAPLIAFIFLLDRFVISSEEEKLVKIFAKDYIDYKKRVRRWI